MNAAVSLAVLTVLTVGPTELPAPPAGHFARDFTGSIPASTLEALDAIGREVNESGAGQIGVAVIDSTGGVPARRFATDLFNFWGVGHAGADDGVLIFVALKDRKAEIIVGDGLLSDRLTSAVTDRVMHDDVVPNFKAGRPAEGLVAAAGSLSRALAQGRSRVVVPPPAPSERSEPLHATLLSGEIEDRSPRSRVSDLRQVPMSKAELAPLERVANEIYASDEKPEVHLFVVLFDHPELDGADVANNLGQRLLPRHPRLVVVGVHSGRDEAAVYMPGVDPSAWAIKQAQARLRPLAGPGDWTDALEQLRELAKWSRTGTLPPRPMNEVVAEGVKRHPVPVWGSAGGLAFGALMLLRRWNRNRPRDCKACGRPRQKLAPEKEEPHLSAPQRREQSLKSVDYDVWWCGACRDVQVHSYAAWFSGYSNCRQCKARTLSSSTTTEVTATYDHGGRVRVNEQCENCSYSNSYTRSTARLQRSRSSSSSSSWSSSRSSSSSFGGGRSSGGGSSGSW